MALPDATGALIALLKAEPSVSAFVGGRVFGQVLPGKETRYMPRPVILIQNTGGGGLPGLSKFLSEQVDILTYGSTESEAKQLELTVIDFLNGLLRKISGQTLIYSCQILTTGYFDEHGDKEPYWPVFTTIWNINSSLRAVV